MIVSTLLYLFMQLIAVPSPEVPMAILHNKLKAAKTVEETTNIMDQIIDLQNVRFHSVQFKISFRNIVV